MVVRLFAIAKGAAGLASLALAAAPLGAQVPAAPPRDMAQYEAGIACAGYYLFLGSALSQSNPQREPAAARGKRWTEHSLTILNELHAAGRLSEAKRGGIETQGYEAVLTQDLVAARDKVAQDVSAARARGDLRSAIEPLERRCGFDP
ncbi:hypothetical protein ACLBKU_02265 [Erythrobacter sp. NE805]|uniref:hypothetical protein n=1 Tax=Erythrobacter sp. NE805 TaxID=3389875 RepID=UPI00396B1EFB